MQYFKHELTTRDDDRIFELIESHGVTGYGLWWVILEELYKSETAGFQIDASETWFKRISKDLNITDYRTPIRILDTMAELGLIDSQLWADHVIFAPGISKRADAYMRRKALAAERKRQQRERDRQAREAANQQSKEKPKKPGVSRVTDAGQPPCHTSVTTNADPDADADADPDQIFKLSLDPDPESESEKGDPISALLQQVAALRVDVIPGAMRTDWYFAGLLPWRDRNREVLKDFAVSVGKQISFHGERETMTPENKGRRHIERLENTPDGVRQLIAYWRQHQESAPPPLLHYETYEPTADEIKQAARGLA